MANVLYAFSEGEDINGDVCRVEIWGPYRGDAPVEFTAGYPFCFLKWSRNEDEIYTDPFMFGEADINLLLETTAQEAILDGIAQSQENTYSVQIKVDGVRYWTGLLLPDTLTVEIDCNPANINIRASDGWQVLKASKNAAPAMTLHDAFYTLLGQLKNFEFYDPNFQSVFYQPQFEIIGSPDQVFVDAYFYHTAENDFEFLKAILNDLGMYVVQTNGYWYIIGLMNVGSGVFNGTWYREINDTPISSATLNYSTIVVNTDRGGIKRFTRPFNTVQSNYKASKLVTGYNDSKSYSPAADISDHTIYDEFIHDQVDEKMVLKIDLNSDVSVVTGSNNYQVNCDVVIKCGVNYYDGQGFWQPSYIRAFRFSTSDYEFSGTDIKAFVWATMEIPFEDLGTTALSQLTIDCRYSIWDVPNVAPVNGNILGVNFGGVITAEDVNIESSYTTDNTDTPPILTIDHYFNDGGILKVDVIESLHHNDIVDDQWQWSAGVGSPTGYLQKLRADAIASLITNAETLFEISCDNLNGPASFYRIIKLQKLMPIQIDQDMIRREGKLLGLRL
jgi:hypothetical protein